MSEMNENDSLARPKGTICVGVDPGKLGAMAVLYPNGGIIIEPFSEESFLVAFKTLSSSFFAGRKIVVAIEHVGGIPGQSAPAAFNFGDNFGFIRGVVAACGLPYELVRPQKWKKEFSCTSDKNTSIEVAKRLFPGVDLKRTERCRKDDDGFAEALLLAEYARRRMS